MSDKSSQADWQGVGDSVKDLGRKLKEHASEAQDAIKTTSAPLSGVAAQVGAVFRTGMAKLDETVSDPAVGAAARGAAGKFLDALKAQLGADQPAESATATPEPAKGSKPTGKRPDTQAPDAQPSHEQGNDQKATPGT